MDFFSILIRISLNWIDPSRWDFVLVVIYFLLPNRLRSLLSQLMWNRNSNGTTDESNGKLWSGGGGGKAICFLLFRNTVDAAYCGHQRTRRSIRDNFWNATTADVNRVLNLVLPLSLSSSFWCRLSLSLSLSRWVFLFYLFIILCVCFFFHLTVLVFLSLSLSLFLLLSFLSFFRSFSLSFLLQSVSGSDPNTSTRPTQNEMADRSVWSSWPGRRFFFIWFHSLFLRENRKKTIPSASARISPSWSRWWVSFILVSRKWSSATAGLCRIFFLLELEMGNRRRRRPQFRGGGISNVDHP